jgi:hypothetical protein
MSAVIEEVKEAEAISQNDRWKEKKNDLGSQVWDEHVVSHARDEAYRSSYVRQHMSAYVHTHAMRDIDVPLPMYVSTRQHTSAYVRTSA